MTDSGGWNKGRLEHVTHEQGANPFSILTIMNYVRGGIEYATVRKKTGNSRKRNRDIDDVLASSLFEYEYD
ncbi:MAG: hypothetical protein K2H91_01220 [Lachnospiraceae bacterium]|nr:hypothetical protein [Lachnospiraceae bacterium]